MGSWVSLALPGRLTDSSQLFLWGLQPPMAQQIHSPHSEKSMEQPGCPCRGRDWASAALMGCTHELQAQGGRKQLGMRQSHSQPAVFEWEPFVYVTMNCQEHNLKLTVLLKSEHLERAQIIKQLLSIQERANCRYFPREGEECCSKTELSLWEGVEEELQQH